MTPLRWARFSPGRAHRSFVVPGEEKRVNIMDLQALIAKQKELVAVPKTAIIPIVLGGEIVTIELTKFEDPMRWLDLKMAHPPRLGTVDVNIGFNAHALTITAIPECAMVVDGEERQPLPKELWAEMWPTFDAPDIDSLATALWGLNVHEATSAKAAMLGKARKAGSRRKRS